MYLQQSGSGSKYQGQNESFWEQNGNAIVVWGTAARRCVVSEAKKSISIEDKL
jgi:membrane-bound inhibitor of C-type lysozyme